MLPYATAARLAIAPAIVVIAALAQLPAVAQDGDATTADDDPTAVLISADPEVIEARHGLLEAQAQAAHLTQRLDEVAAQFEAAREHALRLDAEQQEHATVVDDAEDRVTAGHAAFVDGVRRAYMLPTLGLYRTAAAVVGADDVAGAIHAGAVMSRLNARQAQDLHAAVTVAAMAVESAGQRGTIASGTYGAQVALTDLSAALLDELAVANDAVGVAEDELATAEAAAHERLEEQEYAAAQALLLGNVARPVVIQGMTCPLGFPNAFADTWLAPRPGGRQHKGVDMFAAYGMPLFAAADGVVTRVWNNVLGGLSVDLYDVRGHRYYYAHLSAAYVVPGQVVAVGDVIGAVGNSGNARFTPPHLHWQFHPHGGGPVNPTPLARALCRAP